MAKEMDESCEVAAFQRFFSFLQEGLQHELSRIAPLLFAEELISSENRDRSLSRTDPPHERAAHLLSVLESRIRFDPASFHSLIRVLDTCPTLKALATKLRSEFRSRKEHQQGPPTEAQVSTEEVHGTNFSFTASSQPVCVYSTALDVKQQIASLEGQFAKLVMQLVCILTMLERQSDDFVVKVRAAVLAIPLSLKEQHHSFLKSHKRKLKQASTVSDILSCLCSYWNYLNVSLFEYMVKMFGGDELKAEFEVYWKYLENFQQNTKLGDFIDALEGDRTKLPPEFVEVNIRLGNSWEDCTLEDAEKLRLRQCRKAEIASHGLYFTGGRRKCIILTWGVAEMAVSSLLSVLDDTEQRECDIEVLASDYKAVAAIVDSPSTAEHTDLTEKMVEPAVPLHPVPIVVEEIPMEQVANVCKKCAAEYTTKCDLLREICFHPAGHEGEPRVRVEWSVDFRRLAPITECSHRYPQPPSQPSSPHPKPSPPLPKPSPPHPSPIQPASQSPQSRALAPGSASFTDVVRQRHTSEPLPSSSQQPPVGTRVSLKEIKRLENITDIPSPPHSLSQSSSGSTDSGFDEDLSWLTDTDFDDPSWCIDYAARKLSFHERLKEPLILEDVMQELTPSNYKEKFHKLLCWEEKEHIDILQSKCDGQYSLVLYQAGLKVPNWLRRYTNLEHKRLGYIQGFTGDQIAYAVQASERVYISQQGDEVKLNILRKNFFHTEERLYVAVERANVQALQECLEVGRAGCERSVTARFELKHSYFDQLHQSLEFLSDEVIERLLPKRSSFTVCEVKKLLPKFKQSLKLDKEEILNDKIRALEVIASCPASGPPVLISGAFGTGKTRLLALATHYFFLESQASNSSVRILVTTQQHISADAFLLCYAHELLIRPQQDVEICRLTTASPRRHPQLVRWCKTMSHFKREFEENSHRYQSKILVVTTCLLSMHMAQFIPKGFFTHIFLDNGAQPREPESIASLFFASKHTKIVIAGDVNQVGPSMLVLGREAQEHGLAMSLLERLQRLYKDAGPAAECYTSVLSTNYRCHQAVQKLAEELFYEMPLRCQVPDDSTHPTAPYPLAFVCSSIDDTICFVQQSVNEQEARITLQQVENYLKSWPPHLGGPKNTGEEVCVVSSHRNQIIQFSRLAGHMSFKIKDIQRQPTYNIQGCEYTAIFISTSEPTEQDGSTCNPTKSICDRYVFNTTITRARSLVVAVGNPFLLLKIEKHMVKKYGEKGKCWSKFLKVCLEKGSLTIDPSVRATQQEKEQCLKKLRQITKVEKKPTLQSPVREPSQPSDMLKIAARALYDYIARSDKELSFKRGDTLYVTEKTPDHNWWDGFNQGTRGFIPVTYVEIIELESVSEEPPQPRETQEPAAPMSRPQPPEYKSSMADGGEKSPELSITAPTIHEEPEREKSRTPEPKSPSPLLEEIPPPRPPGPREQSPTPEVVVREPTRATPPTVEADRKPDVDMAGEPVRLKEEEYMSDGISEDESDSEEEVPEGEYQQNVADLKLTRVQTEIQEQVKLLPLFPSTLSDDSHILPEHCAEFIDPVEIIHCDSSGGIYHNPQHGITLRIPEEAIPYGENLQITIGVGLYGKFKFKGTISPVSAIVWFCSKPKIIFLKPIEVIIPHFLDYKSKEDAKSLEMQFMKASHWNLPSETTQFFPADEKADFISVPNKGILHTRHFCYLCICAGISPEQLRSRRFCIACTVPRSLATGTSVYFYILYFLDTCIESVEKQLPEGYFIQKLRVFSFSDVSHGVPTIIGEYQCSAAEPVTVTLETNRISRDMVDFWQLHENKELKLMEKRKLYPPSMQLTFGDLSSCKEQVVTVLFRGTQEPLEQTKIEIIVKGESSNTQTPPVQSTVKPMPTLRDDIRMCQLLYLRTIPERTPICIIDTLALEWENLGLMIDFDPQGTTVQLIKKECSIDGPVACCKKVLMEWLNGKGAYQPPTWNNLLEILDQMEHSLATTLRNLLTNV